LVVTLFGLVVATTRAPASPRATTPTALVSELYRVHKGGLGPIFNRSGKKYMYRYFDTRLAGLIWKDISDSKPGEVGKLDFDPLFNSQDAKITEFRVGEAKIAGASATVLVTYRNFGMRGVITHRLHRTPRGWRISNVEYGGGDSLVKVLQ
jgi:hypothetical protein